MAKQYSLIVAVVLGAHLFLLASLWGEHKQAAALSTTPRTLTYVSLRARPDTARLLPLAQTATSSPVPEARVSKQTAPAPTPSQSLPRIPQTAARSVSAPSVAMPSPAKRKPPANTAATDSAAPPVFSRVHYRSNPTPIYPRYSQVLGESGRVLLKVTVGKDGVPRAIELSQSSGFARLDNAAVAAVKHWRFHPAMLGNHAIESTALIPVHFRLNRPSQQNG